MKRAEFTRRLAKESRITLAAAADELDRVVHEIFQRVRKGKPASLPGLGRFFPGKTSNLEVPPAKDDKDVPR